MQRNKMMLSELTKYHGQFAVVIAGRNHLVSYGGEEGKAAEYVQKQLEIGKDANPYAILALIPGKD